MFYRLQEATKGLTRTCVAWHVVGSHHYSMWIHIIYLQYHIQMLEFCRDTWQDWLNFERLMG